MKAPKLPRPTDLRAVALHGPCKCPRRFAMDDIHKHNCPHLKYSKSLLVLEWR